MRTLIAIMVFVLLIGCSHVESAKEPERFITTPRVDDFNIVTDKQTGCQYLLIDWGIGNGSRVAITPLLNADGQPTCKQ